MADERIASTDIVPAIALAAELGCAVAAAVKVVMALAGADQGLMDEARARLRSEVERGPARQARGGSEAMELERQRIASREASRKRKADAEEQRIKVAKERLRAKAANEAQRIAIAQDRVAAKAKPKAPRLTLEERVAEKRALAEALREDDKVYAWTCKLARRRDSLRATLGREPTFAEIREAFLRIGLAAMSREALAAEIHSFGQPGASGRGLAIEKELAAMAVPPPLAPPPCEPATPAGEARAEIDPPRTNIPDEPA